MKKHQRIQTNKFGFIANHYSIRKFSVGTASIIVGSLLFLGNPAHAAEANTTQNEPATHQENKVETNIDPIIIDQPQNQAATNNQTPKTEQNHTQANKQQTKSNQAAAVTSDSKSQNDAQASPQQSSTLKQDAVKQPKQILKHLLNLRHNKQEKLNQSYVLLKALLQKQLKTSSFK